MKTTSIEQSTHFNSVIAHMQRPLQDMVDTGIFLEPEYFEAGVPAVTIRKIARRICRDLGRPFVSVEHVHEYWRTIRGANGVYIGSERNPDRPWLYAYIMIPKQKRTMPLATPLLLAAPEDAPRRYANRLDGEIVRHVEYKSKWAFCIYSQDFLEEYLKTVRNDPDMRKVLGLAPK